MNSFAYIIPILFSSLLFNIISSLLCFVIFPHHHSCGSLTSPPQQKTQILAILKNPIYATFDPLLFPPIVLPSSSLPHSSRQVHRKILYGNELTSKNQDKYQWIVAQRTTLSTYNPWALLSRLQMVIPPQSLDNVTKLLVTASRSKCVRDNSCRSSYCLGAANGRCIASTDADLEAFNRNPAGGSFAALIFQLAVFTTYLNEVFLSYWLRLLSQY